MADPDKVGKDWQTDELDAIVEDYFDMLSAEIEGRPYVKLHHNRALMGQIGRTHRSVEYKHMNISAALRELGMPTIQGYKPKPNLQNALFEAIDRYLSRRPFAALVDQRTAAVIGVVEASSLFEEAPPQIRTRSAPRPEGLQRLIRKFDFTESDSRNRALGKAGESLVVDFERRRLQQVDRQDLARKVRWVAQEDGDGAGFDVLSFDAAGEERLIEVKTTCGAQTTPFFLSRNERALASERPDHFRIFRLYEFSEKPRLFKIRPPLETALILQTETYRASFG